jgi:hypothetical protein
MTADADLLQRYNYPTFTPEYFQPWLAFDKSPKLGEAVPDFPLTDLEGVEVGLRETLKAAAYTVVEFGSFT